MGCVVGNGGGGGDGNGVVDDIVTKGPQGILKGYPPLESLNRPLHGGGGDGGGGSGSGGGGGGGSGGSGGGDDVDV